MKAKYFGTLAAISLLSFGVATGCTNPCSAKTAKPLNNAVAQADPCASKANPCAAKSNPCAAKANPCASKANPCASKAQSVGVPLSQALRGKPVVVDVFATWCPACKNIAPTLSQLEQQYDGKVTFVVLDVSDKSTTAKAEAKAKELGLSQFLAANKTQTGSLTIVDPATGKILAQYRNNSNKEDYTKILDAALTGV
jgi:thiol-disulfide isomerase/thioredoxin